MSLLVLEFPIYTHREQTSRKKGENGVRLSLLSLLGHMSCLWGDPGVRPLHAAIPRFWLPGTRSWF